MSHGCRVFRLLFILIISHILYSVNSFRKNLLHSRNAGMELFIIISSFVFLFEALSVIIQVAAYKKTKKRVFKMAPVHHHFQKLDKAWSEVKIVSVFFIVSLIFVAVGVLACIL